MSRLLLYGIEPHLFFEYLAQLTCNLTFVLPNYTDFNHLIPTGLFIQIQ